MLLKFCSPFLGFSKGTAKDSTHAISRRGVPNEGANPNTTSSIDSSWFPTPYEKLKKEISEAGDHLVVINFMTNWCGPCKFMSKHLKKLENCMPEVVFLESDVDKDEKSADEFEIDALPTFKFVYKNKIIPGETVRGARWEKLKIETEKNLVKYTNPPKSEKDFYCDWWGTVAWHLFCHDKVDKCLKNTKDFEENIQNELLKLEVESLPYERLSLRNHTETVIVLLENDSVTNSDTNQDILDNKPLTEQSLQISNWIYESP